MEIFEKITIGWMYRHPQAHQPTAMKIHRPRAKMETGASFCGVNLVSSHHSSMKKVPFKKMTAPSPELRGLNGSTSDHSWLNQSFSEVSGGITCLSFHCCHSSASRILRRSSVGHPPNPQVNPSTCSKRLHFPQVNVHWIFRIFSFNAHLFRPS